MLDDKFQALDSPHLYLILHDMSSGGMNMNLDANLERIQAWGSIK